MRPEEMDRARALERYDEGESIAGICASLGRSRRWLYKWLERREGGEAGWYEERSRRPDRLTRCSSRIEESVAQLRRSLAREGLFCGAQAIQWELEELEIEPRPSITTINRILKRQGLLDSLEQPNRPKSKPYPVVPADMPGAVQQADFVGPRWLRGVQGRGATRFYSLNTVDVAITRCATMPLRDRVAASVVPAIWKSWHQLGMPKFYQVDNEAVFYGSRRHPRGLSQVLRLCLHHGVEAWFIPPSEPWRNGVVEKFNDHWQQKFLRRIELVDFDDICLRSSAFDQQHNSRWRYRKLGGTTPDKALLRSGVKLRTPPTLHSPPLPLSRPTSGRYHLVRFIGGGRQLDLFGERFTLPAQTAHEYIVATVDLATQRLQVRLNDSIVETFDYQFPNA